MSVTGIVHPEQVEMLRRVLDEYCAERQISCQAAYAELAQRVMALFMSGRDSESELAEALRDEARVSR